MINPIFLLKALKKYWKWIALAGVVIFYTMFFYNLGSSNKNSEWMQYEAERVELELRQDIEASRRAAELKDLQDKAAEKREAEILRLKKEAEERATQAEEEAERLRRKNNATTLKLKELQAADPNGPQPLVDGVRDVINEAQDRVRSLRPD